MTAGAPASAIDSQESPPSQICGLVLEKLRSERTQYFGTPEVQLTPAGFKERVFSYVLRVAVRKPGIEEDPQLHLYIKVFKARSLPGTETMRDRVVREYETTRHIHAAMSGSDLRAVRPIACYPEHLAIVTEESRGVTIGTLLETRARWFPGTEARQELADAMRAVGRWVRAFQMIDRRDDCISLDELRNYIDFRLNRLVSEPSSGFGESDRSRVLSHIDRLMPLVAASDLPDVLVHADLAPGNVLVEGQRIVVLDFAMTHRGSLMQDISRLYVQIDLMRAKPQFRPSVIRMLQDALLRGFDPALTPARPLFRIMLLRHHLNHLVTLVVRREKLPTALYNAHLRGVHRRWIAGEVSRDPGEKG